VLHWLQGEWHPSGDAAALLGSGALASGAVASGAVASRGAVQPLHAARDVRISVTGSACGLPSTHAQHFVLRVEPTGASIVASSPSGVRYASQCLRQLWARAGQLGLHALPCCHVSDEPRIAQRGVMLDVSRCRIPTMREFLDILDMLCEHRCTHLQLYIEHTFAYAGHEEVWQGWSALTPDELRTIDSACRERGIELAMNQNCFGHMQHWLRLPKYAHLAETHGDWMFANAWPRTGPWSLCATDDASLHLVRDLLSQQAGCVRGSLCNINCDETYDIAFGRSASEVRERGRTSVYLDYVSRVCRIVRELGKVPMLWGDVVLSHEDGAAPESAQHHAGQLRGWPQGAIALAWDYEGDDHTGVSKFATWGEALSSREIAWWACPGTSSWCSFVGRTRERTQNIRSAVQAATTHNAQGVLLTDWGDHGHWQTWAVARHAIVHALREAWEGEHNANSQRMPHAPPAQVSTLLDTLGDVDLPLREVGLPLSRPNVQGRLRNQTALFADLRLPWNDTRGLTDPEPWEQALDRLNQCETTLHGLPESTLPTWSQERDELSHTIACARFALQRAVARRRTPGTCEPATLQDLAAQAHALGQSHARLWLRRSRVGGLEQSLRAWLVPTLHELDALRG
jgi:hypothetical protein